jgi:hypothetical protein
LRPFPLQYGRAIERFRAKWTPVRVKKTRQIKNPELRFDSIETEKALGELVRKTIGFTDPIDRSYA